METYALVRPEHLNHHGYLFGGVMLKWVDEYAWLTASLDFPGSSFVTVGMDNIKFKRRVKNGSILKFLIKMSNLGKTSVSYSVEVFADEPGDKENYLVFSTNITFVNLDKNEKPARIRGSN